MRKIGLLKSRPKASQLKKTPTFSVTFQQIVCKVQMKMKKIVFLKEAPEEKYSFSHTISFFILKGNCEIEILLLCKILKDQNRLKLEIASKYGPLFQEYFEEK